MEGELLIIAGFIAVLGVCAWIEQRMRPQDDVQEGPSERGFLRTWR